MNPSNTMSLYTIYYVNQNNEVTLGEYFQSQKLAQSRLLKTVEDYIKDHDGQRQVLKSRDTENVPNHTIKHGNTTEYPIGLYAKQVDNQIKVYEKTDNSGWIQTAYKFDLTRTYGITTFTLNSDTTESKVVFNKPQYVNNSMPKSNAYVNELLTILNKKMSPSKIKKLMKKKSPKPVKRPIRKIILKKVEESTLDEITRLAKKYTHGYIVPSTLKRNKGAIKFMKQYVPIPQNNVPSCF